MNAPITKEDFIRPIWFLGAKLFDDDIVLLLRCLGDILKIFEGYKL
jgi:hypothetical protein